jgi:hypothetical protein
MENVKVCKKCGEEKSINDYYNDKKMKDGTKSTCKKCTNDYHKQYLENNVEAKNKFRKSVSEYQKKNLDTILEKRKANKHYLKYQSDYQSNLRANPSYAKAIILRGIVRRFIVKGTNRNMESVLSMVGCSREALKSYLQATAISNGYTDFDIHNYDRRVYQIDHIIPCSKFNLTKEDEIKKCFNWKNMQILTVKENVVKGDSSYAESSLTDTLSELDCILGICVS